jgi:3-oxoacyl-[acyl-carrier-protein] synthase II
MSAMLLRSGEADMMIAVGADAGICPIVMQSLHKAMALSKRNDDPTTASRPFDAERDGFVMGEGAGALILETETHAKARGAKIYAELLGYANNTDGYHVTAPQPEGNGAAACMRLALKKAGLDHVDYINAHGTSTLAGDKAETLAIKSVFSTPPLVSSTKGATGHLMGGGGITEVIACIEAVNNGIVPPTLNLKTPDPDCDLDYVPGTARKAEVTTAMSNAFGFGGQNSSIIVGKYNN